MGLLQDLLFLVKLRQALPEASYTTNDGILVCLKLKKLHPLGKRESQVVK